MNDIFITSCLMPFSFSLPFLSLEEPQNCRPVATQFEALGSSGRSSAWPSKMAGLDSVSFDFQERFMQKREPLSDPNFNWERFEVTAQSNRSRSSYQLQVEPAGSSPAVQLQPPQKENVRGRKGKELFESILRSRYPSSLGSSGQCYRSGRQVFQNVANERGRARANVFVQFQTRTKDRLDEKWLKENRRTWYEEASGYNPLVSAFKDKLEAYKKSRDRERERESAETEQGTETTTCGLTSHLEAEETSGSSEETGGNEEGTYGATKVEDQQELSTSRRYQESVRQNNCADVGDVGEVGAAGVAGNVGEEEIDEEEDLACPEPAPLPDKMFQTQELSFGSVAGNALVEEVEEAQVHRHQSQNETTEDNASNGEESPSTFKPRSPLKVKEQSVACESQGGSSGQKDLESELQRREKEVDSLKLMNENLRNR